MAEAECTITTSWEADFSQICHHVQPADRKNFRLVPYEKSNIGEKNKETEKLLKVESESLYKLL